VLIAVSHRVHAITSRPKNYLRPRSQRNLITVPACDNCNNGASEDDEVFRNELSIMAGGFGESVNAAERLQPTMRAIRRNRVTLGRMVSDATYQLECVPARAQVRIRN
jgi:hypothetical protein